MIKARREVGIWRHFSQLPATKARVTLGEGSTPLVPIETGKGRASVYGKLESLNPTLSFKDRGMALATSVAIDQGCRGLVVASTGNAAVSAAAYSAVADIECEVIVGAASRATQKLDACRAYGANVSEVDGDYSDAYAYAAGLSGEGFMNVSTTYQNEYITKGYLTIATELWEQLGSVPDVVVVPIGAGPLLAGIDRGFRDLLARGEVDCTPAMIGVQAANCAPIASAWASGRSLEAWSRTLHGSFRMAPTVATAIADPLRGYEEQGLITLNAVDRSGGKAVAVEESDIINATLWLRNRGLWVESSSATAFAALRQLSSWLDEDTNLVLMLTGHGVKNFAESGAL